MKRNNSKSRYGSLSSLKALRYEKQLLQYKIERKEKEIEKDWTAIYDRWNFISVALDTLHSAIAYIPIGISAISRIIRSFEKKKKQNPE
ncbi:MAG: hypothetical protein LBL13_08375 [Bacteroidales bacterium]|jgi:hypothetical protein|nr:hypothetical protein [Bacteroidales bacterium]